ncbi:hypothetical protein D3C81_1156390 [compost metagenome]
MDAGSRPDIDNMIRCQHRIFIVFDDDQRIAEVTHMVQSGDQLIIVPLVQPDARFVKDIQDAHQTGSDLRSQPDTLRFAAG